MPPYAGPSAPRLGDAAGTLRLLAYLAAAVALVVLDHRGGWMHRVREQITAVVEPVRVVAGLPGSVADSTMQNVGTISQLAVRNRELRRELLLAQARIARMSTVIGDNARLRAMLDTAQRGGMDVQLAPILNVDLDPTHQRLVLDAGSRDGVHPGQSVIDAYGLLGQVTRVGPIQSEVLLITDPDHAVPVALARNGVRLVAYGTGRNDLLSLASIPLSSDIKVGDLVVTSGLGGRFPPGFPVGRVVALRPDESRAFLQGDVRPAAQLDRGREVLLLRSAPTRLAAPVVLSTISSGDAPVPGSAQSMAMPGQGAPGAAPSSATIAAATRTAAANNAARAGNAAPPPSPATGRTPVSPPARVATPTPGAH